MAPVVTMKQLLEAGVHFGHQTRRWNPKMKRFIYGERNGIYIIDLQQTLRRIETAYSFVRDLVANGGTVLFVGTKKQAQDSIARTAGECGMPYINERWLGGMLTNFTTISGRVKKMQELQSMRAVGDFEAMPKKEALQKSRELEKLERNLSGIRDMAKLPDAVFVIDTKKEHIGVTEANKLRVPVVAVVDTNCDPDLIDYVIPGNDDAIRSGTLMCRVIGDAVKEGRYIAERKGTARPAPPTAEQEAERARQQAAARSAAARQRDEREARMAAKAPDTDTAPDTATVAATAPAPALDTDTDTAPAPDTVAATAPAPAPAPAEGSGEETDAVVPQQAAPEMGQEPGGEPEPHVQAPPSDAVEPAPGAIPTRDDDIAVAAEFPHTQPGSAAHSPVGSHGGDGEAQTDRQPGPQAAPANAGGTSDDLAPPSASEPDGVMTADPVVGDEGAPDEPRPSQE
ncbi:MAG: 30S ribosomal protein S2 [Actinobacteria bacterium]|nr:30S ribosomal protein S2 [Actinomycetota bacterium]